MHAHLVTFEQPNHLCGHESRSATRGVGRPHRERFATTCDLFLNAFKFSTLRQLDFCSAFQPAVCDAVLDLPTTRLQLLVRPKDSSCKALVRSTCDGRWMAVNPIGRFIYFDIIYITRACMGMCGLRATHSPPPSLASGPLRFLL